MSEDFRTALRRTPIIAILRGVTTENIVAVCEALAEPGIRCIEVTLNTENALECIRLAAKRFCGMDVHIGAGTALTSTDVDAARDAGATYIISPNFNPAVVRRTKELGLISIPGFFTPSEAFAAIEAGADYLKFFPAGVLGVPYVRYLRAVLPHPIIPVGGVTPDNLAEYLEVCDAVGIGTSFFKPGRVPEEVKKAAQKYIQHLPEKFK